MAAFDLQVRPAAQVSVPSDNSAQSLAGFLDQALNERQHSLNTRKQDFAEGADARERAKAIQANQDIKTGTDNLLSAARKNLNVGGRLDSFLAKNADFANASPEEQAAIRQNFETKFDENILKFAPEDQLMSFANEAFAGTAVPLAERAELLKNMVDTAQGTLPEGIVKTVLGQQLQQPNFKSLGGSANSSSGGSNGGIKIGDQLKLQKFDIEETKRFEEDFNAEFGDGKNAAKFYRFIGDPGKTDLTQQNLQKGIAKIKAAIPEASTAGILNAMRPIMIDDAYEFDFDQLTNPRTDRERQASTDFVNRARASSITPQSGGNGGLTGDQQFSLRKKQIELAEKITAAEVKRLDNALNLGRSEGVSDADLYAAFSDLIPKRERAKVAAAVQSGSPKGKKLLDAAIKPIAKAKPSVVSKAIQKAVIEKESTEPKADEFSNAVQRLLTPEQTPQQELESTNDPRQRLLLSSKIAKDNKAKFDANQGLRARAELQSVNSRINELQKRLPSLRGNFMAEGRAKSLLESLIAQQKQLQPLAQ